MITVVIWMLVAFTVIRYVRTIIQLAEIAPHMTKRLWNWSIVQIIVFTLPLWFVSRGLWAEYLMAYWGANLLWYAITPGWVIQEHVMIAITRTFEILNRELQHSSNNQQIEEKVDAKEEGWIDPLDPGDIDGDKRRTNMKYRLTVDRVEVQGVVVQGVAFETEVSLEELQLSATFVADFIEKLSKLQMPNTLD